MARIKVHGRRIAVSHCMSRVVGGQTLLDDIGKEKLVEIVWQLASFCGLEVITYCIISNHVHVLVRVPGEQNPSDQELVERLEALKQRVSRWYNRRTGRFGTLWAES